MLYFIMKKHESKEGHLFPTYIRNNVNTKPKYHLTLKMHMSLRQERNLVMKLTNKDPRL